MTDPVLAKFDGLCGACGHSIQTGERIKRDPLDGGDVEWIHATCPRADAPRRVCGECFLEVAVDGSCGCGVLV